jgi:hypothetical protein
MLSSSLGELGGSINQLALKNDFAGISKLLHCLKPSANICEEAHVSGVLPIDQSDYSKQYNDQERDKANQR